jgi:hypothetical protein
MRNTRIILSTFLIAGALSLAAQGQILRGPDSGYARVAYDGGPSLNVDVGFFYDELSPYGRWTEHDSYGPVWTPRSVGSDWQPYRTGRWVDSDYGWTWDSDEPFGWATYHYGRWTFDPDYGWIWIPGTVWGPAWVAWQEGGDYIGWAPLPPSVGFQAGIGLRLGGINLSLALQPQSYVYVEQRYFLEPRISSHCLPRTRNDSIFRQTRNVTRYGYANQRVVNYGVAVDRVERATHRRVQRLRIAEASNRTAVGVRNNELRVFRPRQEQLRTVRVAARNNAGLAAANRRSRANERIAPNTAPNRATAQSRRDEAAQRNRSAAELRREQQVRAEKERQALKPRRTAETNRPDRVIRQEKPLHEREATARAQREQQLRSSQQERSRMEAQRNAQRQATARAQQEQRAAQQQRAAREQQRRNAQRPPVRERRPEAQRPPAREQRPEAQRPPARERRPEAQRPPVREGRPESVKPNERRGQGAQAKPQTQRKPRQKPPGDGNPPPGT